MLEPPPHQGPFARAELMETAVSLLGKPTKPDYTLECFGLAAGKLTLLIGPWNSERSRFLVGLIGGALMQSLRGESAPTIWFFNRRWTAFEAHKSLVHFLASRSSVRSDGSATDALVWAIEHIENSGLHYDSVCRSINAVYKKVKLKSATHPARLVIVDGLEHFDVGSEGAAPRLSAVRVLSKLARETSLPVLATFPMSPELDFNALRPLTHRIIQLSS